MFVPKKALVFVALLILIVAIGFITSCATNDPLDLMYVQDLYTYDTLTSAWVKLPTAGGAGDMLRAVYDPDLDGIFATAQLASTVVIESDVDDIPVNGVTTDPISSNWAFDHNADVTTKHLPDQAGNAGEFLTTDGAVASWAATGAGDMTKAEYDPDTDGVIAIAELDTGLTLVDGTRPFTGTVGGIDPVASSDLATKEYVDTSISGSLWEYFFNNTASGISYYYTAANPTGEAESSITTATAGGGNGFVVTGFITDSATGWDTVNAGVLHTHIHAERTAGTRSVNLYAEFYERASGGGETLIATTEVSGAITAKTEVDLHATLVANYDFDPTSKLVIKFLANIGLAGSNVDITLYAEGTTSSRMGVTAPSAGLFTHAQNTDTRIQDTDADTKIQTEEAADEDKIRFDTGGTERLVLDSTGLDFKTLKAIAMSCDNGATVPASPVVGQWFLHTPTGRNILMQYSGSAWIPIISFGTMMLYVDNTDGTDGATYGTGVDANAFKTIQYAVNTIPGLVGGSVTININGETYSETVTIQGKAFTGNYNITLQGTLTESRSASQTSSVQGATSTYGSISDTGNLGSYDNKLIYSSNNAEYRIIDSDDANTATIVGYWTAAPSGNYKIYDWATTISSIVVEQAQTNVYVQFISVSGLVYVKSYASLFLNYSKVINSGWHALYVSHAFISLTGALINQNTTNGYSIALTQVAAGEFANSKFIQDGAQILAAVNHESQALFWQPCVFDGIDKGAVYGLQVQGNSSVSMELVYHKVRNLTTGLYTGTGGQIFNTGNDQYTNNTTNESATAASYGYID